MKMTKKVLFLVLACLLAFAPICMATDVNPNARGDADKGSESVKVLDNDLYLGDQDIVIENTVNGNVFAFGSNVTVKGENKGDLFVMANSLTIEESAVINNNIFAFASNIAMKGKAYDIYAFGQNFELAKTGYIYRDVKLYAGKITLNGIIKKNAYIASDSIIIPEDAKNIIEGSLTYSSDNEFTFPEGAVAGEVIHSKPVKITPTTQQIISSYITSFITTIIYAIVVILLATFFTPKFIEKSNYTLMKRPFVSTGIGILAIVLIPVLAIMLLMTGFLSYVSFAVLVLYGLILSITLPIFSLAIAKSIEKKLKNPTRGKFILFSILSAAVLWLLQIVPYVGGYLSLFIYVVGLGVFLFSFFIRKDVSELEKKAEAKE